MNACDGEAYDAIADEWDDLGIAPNLVKGRTCSSRETCSFALQLTSIRMSSRRLLYRMNKNTLFKRMLVAMCFVSPAMVLAQTSVSANLAEMITSPGAVNNQLATDQVEPPGLLGTNELKSWDEWKASFADPTGLGFGIDYNVLGRWCVPRVRHLEPDWSRHKEHWWYRFQG